MRIMKRALLQRAWWATAERSPCRSIKQIRKKSTPEELFSPRHRSPHTKMATASRSNNKDCFPCVVFPETKPHGMLSPCLTSCVKHHFMRCFQNRFSMWNDLEESVLAFHAFHSGFWRLSLGCQVSQASNSPAWAIFLACKVFLVSCAAILCIFSSLESCHCLIW